MNLQRLARREVKRAQARRDCEAGGGHYYVDAGSERMPDGVDYPLQTCRCGARRLLPAEK